MYPICTRVHCLYNVMTFVSIWHIDERTKKVNTAHQDFSYSVRVKKYESVYKLLLLHSEMLKNNVQIRMKY